MLVRLTICTQTLSADTRKSFLNIGASIAKRPADLLDYFPECLAFALSDSALFFLVRLSICLPSLGGCYLLVEAGVRALGLPTVGLQYIVSHRVSLPANI